MKLSLTCALVLSLLLIAAPVSAAPATLYVDATGACAGNVPCYAHPQDAVNAASPGDIIRVYPGVYGSRISSSQPPHYGPNDQYAPALIVYKDGLTIESIEGPANTIIESTHDYWSNPVAVQASTGGVWNDTAYVGAGVYPAFGSAPNAISVIASGVTIRGFTVRKPFMGVDWKGFFNTAGIMIGGLYLGDSTHLGAGGNTVQDCIFRDVHHAVFIWHSSNNRIANNRVEELRNTQKRYAISIYDGFSNDEVRLGYSSRDNTIINNTLANWGIFVGAWNPSLKTDNTGTKVHGNELPGGAILTANSTGSKQFAGNVTLGCYAVNATDWKCPGNSNHRLPPNWEGY